MDDRPDPAPRSRRFPRTRRRRLLVATGAVILAAVALAATPLAPVIPVAGATPSDWNHASFWYHPWGRSIVHRGIDIFAPEGRPVVAAVGGVVIATGPMGRGGNVVIVLDRRLRLHYYAHLRESGVRRGALVGRGEPIGTVGRTGNAASTPAHLHYTILTLVPCPWRVDGAPLGVLKMFYLDPGAELLGGRSGGG